MPKTSTTQRIRQAQQKCRQGLVVAGARLLVRYRGCRQQRRRVLLLIMALFAISAFQSPTVLWLEQEHRSGGLLSLAQKEPYSVPKR